MSMGWQTESAILPSKARPIKVDSTSILGLKALVYSEEQKRSTNNKSIHHRQGIHKTKQKDKFPQSEEISPQLNTCDSRDSDNKEERVFSALTAKAKLYEDMMNGTVCGAPVLVNFQSKSNCVAPKDDYKVSTVITDVDEFGRSAHQYNWSKGEEAEDSLKMYLREQQDERELKRAIENKIKDESSLTIHSTTTVSAAARVKTQWEKTLNSSARGFIDQIHKETEAERQYNGESETKTGSFSTEQTVGGRKRSLREERLEMLKAKQQKVNSR